MQRDRTNAEKANAQQMGQLKTLNQNRLDFLDIDLDTALTLADIAVGAQSDSQKRQRNTANARKAYDTVIRFARRVQATANEAQRLDDKLEKLRTALQRLGETV